MVWIDLWEDFESKAKALFLQDPDKTRYTMKYRQCDQMVVLKVTDDKTCLKYKTNQQSEMKNIEKLNNIFFGLMSSPSLDAVTVDRIEADAQPEEEKPTTQPQVQGKKKKRAGKS